MNELEFYLFNGGKYPYIPRRDQQEKSIFITTPNSYYDPMRGQRTIEDFLQDMAFGETLGYDGLVVLEQHGGPNAVAGQSIVMASALAARTSKIRIGTVGALMNSYLTPMRYAEEVVALDHLSRGRYFFGLPMGIGANYHAFPAMNPTQARARHREGHDLMKKAFTDEGPFEWDGEFFRATYANLWPKPLQDPHPEIWIPASGSRESLEMAAREHYTYLAVLVPWPVIQKNVKLFRELCNEAGYEADPRQITAQAYVHVAETEQQARQEMEAHHLSILQNSLGSPFHDSFPPGHVTERSLRGMAAGGGYRSKDISETTIEQAVADKQLIYGTPEQVAEQIEEITTTMGAGRLVLTQDMWTMPSWLTRKSMTLFAEQVMPRFRQASGGRPVWDRDRASGPAYGTIAEYGARLEEPKARPTAWVDGEVIDLRTSHIPELRTPLTDVSPSRAAATAPAPSR